MRQKGHQRRLASIFLGLFLGMLAMVTLHDLSHRAEVVQAVVVSRGECLATHTSHVDCSLCQFVHTPFLALALGVVLTLEMLGVRVLRVALCEAVGSFSPRFFSLRAPPSLTLV